jgi:hypothetical protein
MAREARAPSEPHHQVSGSPGGPTLVGGSALTSNTPGPACRAHHSPAQSQRAADNPRRARHALVRRITIHARAAAHVLSTPDALLTLVLGGDHLKDGVDAVKAALGNPVLRPHFAYIEAKRLCQGFFARQPELEQAAALLDGGTVLNASEARKAASMLSSDSKAGPAPRGDAEERARAARAARARAAGLETSRARLD